MEAKDAIGPTYIIRLFSVLKAGSLNTIEK
jgi:hypothetical protein